MKFRMLLGAFCLFTIVHGDNIFAAVPIGLDLQLDDAFKKEGETTSIFLAGLETNWENNGGFAKISFLRTPNRFNNYNAHRTDIDFRAGMGRFTIVGLKFRDIGYLWEKREIDFLFKNAYYGYYRTLVKKNSFIVDMDLVSSVYSTWSGVYWTVELGYNTVYKILHFSGISRIFHFFGITLDNPKWWPNVMDWNEMYIGDAYTSIGYDFKKVPLSLKFGYGAWRYNFEKGVSLQGRGSLLRIIYRL